MPKLYIYRGLPGTGKSTAARELGIFHVEADMFHMRDGKYQFDPERVKEAHGFCRHMFEEAVRCGIDVAVSNTFTQHWEMEPYKKFAYQKGYDLTERVFTTEYGTIHNVPQEVIDNMRERWED